MPTEAQHSVERFSVPPWLWVISVAYLVVGLFEFLPSGYRLSGYTVPYFLYSGISGLAGGLSFFWAAGRGALGIRLRQSLILIGSGFCLTGLTYFRQVFEALGVVESPHYLISHAITFATYFLALIGIFWMPTLAVRRATLWTITLDLAVTVLGMAAILALAITMPQVAAGSDLPSRSLTLTYGAAQILMLVGVNVLVLRGSARPGRRAFWLLVSVFFLNLMVTVAAQFEASSGPGTVSPFAELGVSLASACTWWAAVAFRRDPLLPGDVAPGPRWFATFNPLPLLAVAGVAALLLCASYAPGTWSVQVFASTMVAQVALLLARLFLTSKENARLLREEVELEKQMHARKAEAVRRLAGGMAHWYNNLLTTVIGHAELGLLADKLDPSVKRDFALINAAAERAARITRQMLSYSGGQFFKPVPFDVHEMIGRIHDQITPMLPPGITIQVAPGSGGLLVRADLPRMESVVHELVANAVSAMPSGGTVSILAGRESIETPIDASPLPVAPGDYAVIEVADTGTGIPPDRLALIFDPFFTTHPIHSAPGLGLAEVYGVVAAHGGGLMIRSALGQGTSVKVYLPVGEPAGGITGGR